MIVAMRMLSERLGYGYPASCFDRRKRLKDYDSEEG